MKPKAHSSRFSLSARLHSFGFAWRGLKTLVSTQHNARIHAVAATLVMLVGLGADISRVEWTFLVLAIVAVWVCEAMNTAIEFLCDVVSPEFHPLIKKAKDLAAAAVLIAAFGALAIALLVFAPYLSKVLEGSGLPTR